ncbi:putative 77 kDa echinoderm microtubule-associated protein [Paratrimastix pyriformis]|uniref:77 kDa echinoderm microtubule-associated protein n=1 Tax=Paratrimastix pyriformis TaxID=342808 RepID=A0ABQ8UN01_9EUKA|nr:putative 77 kDa echinoderm microtubule-associated protein [Paratrimastix pyriformis]|eukprot:GAFH01001017.1.p2 GENE.GAFH01001017.1~~GAFH01001017.1.p2  ORF type:complete len:674 (-),score=268.35 GAFH01001017.1:92-2089(-)
MGCGASTPVVQSEDGELASNYTEDPTLMSAAPGTRRLTNHIANRFAKGTIDSTAPPNASSMTFRMEAPEETLVLEHCFGYRGKDSRNNVCYLNDHEIVYPIAGTAVVHNVVNNEQRFYLGHDNDIMCLTVNNAKDLVATGQESFDPRKSERGVKSAPSVHLWNPITMATVAVLKGHTTGIKCLTFSPDGRFLASIGYDDNHTLCVWDVASHAMVGTCKTGANQILAVRWDNQNPNRFAAVGPNTIYFFTIEGAGIKCSRGQLKDVKKLKPFPSVAYMADGTPVVGTSEGELYFFRGIELETVKNVAAGEPISVLHPLPDGLLVLTSRQIMRFAGQGSKIAPAAASRLPMIEGIPVAVSVEGDHIAVGTRSNEILTGHINMSTLAVAEPRLVQQGHSDELWGLEICPSNPAHVLTACDDKTVRRWDIQAHRMVSSFALPGKARTLDVAADGTVMAVGSEDGKVYIVDPQSGQIRQTINASPRPVAQVKFSPNSQLLATGNADSKINVYAAPSWNLLGSMVGHHATVGFIDWSRDSQYIRSNSADCELLFWNAATRTQITATASMASTEWSTNTCVITWAVQGIWPPDSDRTDINSIDLHPSRPLLAMGDDFRQVELANYPCIDRASAKKTVKGHSEHVTNVRWSRDGNRLVSCGGLDAGVFVWRLQ